MFFKIFFKSLTEIFFWGQICDNYLEIAKDRLYNPDARGNEERKSAQYTLNYLISNTLKLFAPIVPFISEEIYQYFDKDGESIHTSDWPELNDEFDDGIFGETWDKFIEVLSEVRQEKAKNNKSLTEEIVLTITDKDNKILITCLDDLKAVTKAKEIKIGKKLKVIF